MTSDGTVAAVGVQIDSPSNFTGLILQNAASAPKTATTSAAIAASDGLAMSNSSAGTRAPVTTATIAAQPRTAPLGDTPVDRLLISL